MQATRALLVEIGEDRWARRMLVDTASLRLRNRLTGRFNNRAIALGSDARAAVPRQAASEVKPSAEQTSARGSLLKGGHQMLVRAECV